MCSRSWINGSSRDALKSGEKWRRPHHHREHHPGHDRVRQEPHDARVEERDEPATARLAGAQAQDEGDRRGQCQERRGNEHQQDVLDHVDREEARVIALDARDQCERQREHPGQEGDRSPSRDGVVRVDRIDPADRPQPPDHGRPDGEGRDRLPRPSEQQGRRGRRLGWDGAVGEDRAGRHGGRKQPGQSCNGRSDRPSSGHRRDGRTNRRRGRLDFTADPF